MKMKTAADIMTVKIISVTAETSLKEFARTLVDNSISGAPVLDASGKLVGIATLSDLIYHNKKLKVPAFITILDSFLFLDTPEKMEKELKKIAAATVGDICTHEVISITPDTLLDEIATIMTEKKVHSLPVIGNNNQMVGIVGKKDIIKTIL